MHTIHTIPEADAFFASLPEGFDTPQDFAAALPPAESEAPVGYIPVAGTAGRTAAYVFLTLPDAISGPAPHYSK